jgi:hypothetical protein
VSSTISGDTTLKLIPYESSDTSDSSLIRVSKGNSGSAVTVFSRIGYSDFAVTYDANSILSSTQATTYADQLSRLQYTRVNDLLLLATEFSRPIFIQATPLAAFYLGNDSANAAISTTVSRDARPYDAANTSDDTWTLSSATTGSRTATHSNSGTGPIGHGFTQDVTPGDSVHVGTWMRIETGFGYITAVPSATTVTIQLVTSPTGVGPFTDWSYDQWRYVDSELYRPKVVAFFDERVWLMNSARYPNRIWASAVGDYDNFRVPSSPSATDPIEIDLSSNSDEEIRWALVQDRLLVGTSSGEWSIEPDSTGYTVTRRSTTGSIAVQGIAVANTAMFAEKSGKQVREMFFERDSEGYQTEDLNRLADHIVGYDSPSGALIEDLSWQQSETTLWVLDDNGGLACLLRDRRIGSAAWERHEIGGSSVIATAVATLNNPDKGHDDVWVACTRVAGGSTYYTVEVMRQPWQKTNMASSLSADRAQYSCVYLDGAVTSAGTGTVSSMTGLAHFNGETVDIFIDGQHAGTGTPSGGSLTLPYSGTVVVVGKKYTSLVETLDIDAGSAVGSSIGSVKQIDRVTVRFHKTCAAKIGPADDDLQTISFRNYSDALNDPITPFTGDKTIEFKGSNDREARVVISTDSPYPLTVCGLFLRGVTNDG